MWCANCHAEVAAEVAPDNRRVHCASCGAELSAGSLLRTTDKTREARELLERWASDRLLDPYGPVVSPPRPESPTRPPGNGTAPAAESPAEPPETPSDWKHFAPPGKSETKGCSSKPAASTPGEPDAQPPRRRTRTVRIDRSHRAGEKSAHFPESESARPADPASRRPASEPPPREERAASEPPAPAKEPGASPAPHLSPAPPAPMVSRGSAPAAAREPALEPDPPVSLRAGPAPQVHAPHPGVPAPHFDIQAAIVDEPSRKGGWLALAGQFLAYGGVLALTIGTTMVLSGWFVGGEQWQRLAPTGWLIMTAGQMLLFLGVVTLVSGGMEQTTEEVRTRLEVLGHRLVRIEQASRDHALRGPSIPAERFRTERPEAETATQTASR